MSTVTLISWVDCNDHGEPHRWTEDHRVITADSRWFKCQRCPVTSTLSRGHLRQHSQPATFLR